MLRNSLVLSVRMNYNNFNNWRRYHKAFPLQAEEKIFKKQFKEGDQPEFAYDNKIIWPAEYKPWNSHTPYQYAIGAALVLLYLDWRTDYKRQKQGITLYHPYPI